MERYPDKVMPLWGFWVMLGVVLVGWIYEWTR